MPDDNAEAREAAQEYAWKWFEYHAGQRMIVFRFFLVLTGALAAGCFAFLQQRRYGMLALLTGFLMVFTFLFWRLDRRNRELVKIAEVYLQLEEQKLAITLGTDTIRLARIADQREWPRPLPPKFARELMAKLTPYLGTYFTSFGQINQWLFASVGIASILLLFYSLTASLLCAR